MTHVYNLRPNAKGRRRLANPHIARVGGEEVMNKLAAAAPHLFDREPDRAIKPQRTDSTKVAIEIEPSNSEDSASTLGSDLITIIDPDSPYHTHTHGQSSPSPLRMPPALRRIRQRNWQGVGVASSAGAGPKDSMASIAERRKARRSRDDYIQTRRRFMEEELRRVEGRDTQVTQVEQQQDKRDLEERLPLLRQDYERRVEQFRKERADMFAPRKEESDDYESYTPTPTPVKRKPGAGGRASLDSWRPHFPQSAGPSLRGPHQERRTLRRQGAQRFSLPAPQTRKAGAVNSAAERPFVVVAQRVHKLGPCGTVVIDHETGQQMVETRRYRVRADELHSIDEEGDSVMGDDEYFVCASSDM